MDKKLHKLNHCKSYRLSKRVAAFSFLAALQFSSCTISKSQASNKSTLSPRALDITNYIPTCDQKDKKGRNPIDVAACKKELNNSSNWFKSIMEAKNLKEALEKLFPNNASTSTLERIWKPKYKRLHKLNPFACHTKKKKRFAKVLDQYANQLSFDQLLTIAVEPGIFANKGRISNSYAENLYKIVNPHIQDCLSECIQYYLSKSKGRKKPNFHIQGSLFPLLKYLERKPNCHLHTSRFFVGLQDLIDAKIKACKISQKYADMLRSIVLESICKNYDKGPQKSKEYLNFLNELDKEVQVPDINDINSYRINTKDQDLRVMTKKYQEIAAKHKDLLDYYFIDCTADFDILYQSEYNDKVFAYYTRKDFDPYKGNNSRWERAPAMDKLKEPESRKRDNPADKKVDNGTKQTDSLGSEYTKEDYDPVKEANNAWGDASAISLGSEYTKEDYDPVKEANNAWGD